MSNWTLGQTLTRLADRLGETSTVFWTPEDRIRYVNDAQTFVSSVTRGLEESVIDSVSTSAPFVTLPTKTLSIYSSSGHIVDGNAINTVSVKVANLAMPNWRTLTGSYPMWFVIDLEDRKAYVTPLPSTSTSVRLSVAVLPNEFATDGTDNAEYLFQDSPSMTKYQGATLQLAAVYALLKERYDQEAERYYQFFMQEMTAVGIDPTAIPPFEEVSQNVSVER